VDELAATVWARDLFCCVSCGKFIHEQSIRGVDFSIHHRVLGNTADRRWSNLILLCGSGTTGCHGWAHCEDRAGAEELGYIVRHGFSTLERPVFMRQRQVGRFGKFLLTDDANVEPLAA